MDTIADEIKIHLARKLPEPVLLRVANDAVRQVCDDLGLLYVKQDVDFADGYYECIHQGYELSKVYSATSLSDIKDVGLDQKWLVTVQIIHNNRFRVHPPQDGAKPAKARIEFSLRPLREASTFPEFVYNEAGYAITLLGISMLGHFAHSDPKHSWRQEYKDEMNRLQARYRAGTPRWWITTDSTKGIQF